MASFDENGKYIKTNWKAGDKITATKLNKIEESIEDVNDNDISRHAEADARLDALEAKDVAHDKEFTNVKNLIADNKAAAELGDYEINSRMTFLENELNEGIEEVHNVAEIVDGKINAADASMKATVAEVEADLEGLHAKDEELSTQLAQKANVCDMPYVFASDFGVVGDGVTDDSGALQKAIDSLPFGGVIRFKNPCKIKITKQIIVKPYVVLYGCETVQGKRKDNSCAFYIEHGLESDVSTFKLKQCSGIKGFRFYYPNQSIASDESPKVYSYTIDTTADVGDANTDDITLENIILENSYQGIKLVNAGRFNLKNVYGQPIRTGIYADNVLDVSRMTNIHFWPFSYPSGSNMRAWISENGVAFDLGNIDHVTITSAFAFGYNYGFKFFEGFWGDLVSCCVDGCYNPIHVYKVDQLRILGGSFVTTNITNPVVFIHPDLTGRFILNGASIWGKNIIAIHSSANTGEVNISNCDIKDGKTNNTDGWKYAGVVVDGVAPVKINSCVGLTGQTVFGGNNVEIDGVKLPSLDTRMSIQNLSASTWVGGIPDTWNVPNSTIPYIEQINGGIRLKHIPNGTVTNYISYRFGDIISKTWDVFIFKITIDSTNIPKTADGRFYIKFGRNDGGNIVYQFRNNDVTFKYSKKITLNIPVYFGKFPDICEVRIEWQAFGSDNGYIDLTDIELYKTNINNLSNNQINKIIKERFLDPYKNNSLLNVTNYGNKQITGTGKPNVGEWNKGDKIINTNYSLNNEGWVCVDSGTPGLWKSYGVINN